MYLDTHQVLLLLWTPEGTGGVLSELKRFPDQDPAQVQAPKSTRELWAYKRGYLCKENIQMQLFALISLIAAAPLAFSEEELNATGPTRVLPKPAPIARESAITLELPSTTGPVSPRLDEIARDQDQQWVAGDFSNTEPVTRQDAGTFTSSFSGDVPTRLTTLSESNAPLNLQKPDRPTRQVAGTFSRAAPGDEPTRLPNPFDDQIGMANEFWSDDAFDKFESETVAPAPPTSFSGLLHPDMFDQPTATTTPVLLHPDMFEPVVTIAASTATPTLVSQAVNPSMNGDKIPVPAEDDFDRFSLSEVSSESMDEMDPFTLHKLPVE